MSILYEDKRSQLIARSKRSKREKIDGKTRFEKRVKSRVASSNRQYNSIDMNKFFKNHILTVDIPVTGETDNYIVKVTFGGIMDNIQRRVAQNNDNFDVKTIIRSMIDCFNSEDIYTWCSCPDYRYRMAYWSSKNGTNSGPNEERPSNITNPNDELGPGCKHVMLVLNNNSWIMKVATVIYNYTNYVKDHFEQQYADIIYPAIYGKPYEDNVQLQLEPDETPDIDDANKYARTKNRWTSDTAPRWVRSKNDDENQIEFEDEE